MFNPVPMFGQLRYSAGKMRWPSASYSALDPARAGSSAAMSCMLARPASTQALAPNQRKALTMVHLRYGGTLSEPIQMQWILRRRSSAQRRNPAQEGRDQARLQ